MIEDYGFKVMKKGKIVTDQAISSTLLDSQYPLLNCFVTKTPSPFGYIKLNVGSLQIGETKNILTLNHNYNYITPTMFEWYIPTGNTAGATYGLGDVDAFSPSFDFYTYTAKNTATHFTIDVVSSSSNAAVITNLYAEFRYYVFGNNFEDVVL